MGRLVSCASAYVSPVWSPPPLSATNRWCACFGALGRRWHLPRVVSSLGLTWAGEAVTHPLCGSAPVGISEASGWERESGWEWEKSHAMASSGKAAPTLGRGGMGELPIPGLKDKIRCRCLHGVILWDAHFVSRARQVPMGVPSRPDISLGGAYGFSGSGWSASAFAVTE